MTTKEFSNNIINSMLPYLNPDQINLLSATLVKELYNYDLVEKTTDIVKYSNLDINEIFLKKFAIEKRVQGMSEKTIYQYIRATKNFLDKINKEFKYVTKDDVTYYFALLMKENKITNTSLDNLRRCISSFFKWCTENDYIEKNPFRSIKRIKQEKKIKEILTDSDIVLLKDNCHTLREKALIDFLCATGVRVSELRQVKIKDIDFLTGEVKIYGEKTRTWRKAYLNANAIKHVQDYINDRKYFTSEYLFCSSRYPYNMTCVQTIEIEIQKIAKRANLQKHCTVHLFRRTLATQLYRKGMDMKYIAKLLGHSVDVLEKCYLILDDDNVKSSYQKYALI